MGDLIEITTCAGQPVTFYRVSASGVSFEIKAHSSVLIGLAEEPGDTCQYWCGILHGGRVWLKGPEGMKTASGGNYTLSQNEFTKFWMSWDCGVVRLGIGKELTYLICYPKGPIDLKYVTFTTHDPRFSPTWRIQLPPASLIKVTKNVNCKAIQGGELQWKPAEDHLPDDAIIGGFEGETLYIIRSKFRGSLTPGKFVPTLGVSFIPWGGNAVEVDEFEILCGINYTWESTSEDRIPHNAFVAGYAERTAEKLYIGRVKHKGCVVPGKVQPSHKVCYIAFSSRENSFKSYEILTIPELDVYAAGDYMETSVNFDPSHHAHPYMGGRDMIDNRRNLRDVDEDGDPESDDDNEYANGINVDELDYGD